MVLKSALRIGLFSALLLTACVRQTPTPTPTPTPAASNNSGYPAPLATATANSGSYPPPTSGAAQELDDGLMARAYLPSAKLNYAR